MSDPNVRPIRSTSIVAFDPTDILIERMDFFVGNVLKYLKRQKIETDNQFLLRQTTYAPYINDVMQIIMNMLFGIFKKLPNREELNPFITRLQFWLKGKTVTNQELIFEFAKLFEIYGKSSILSINKEGIFHLFVIDPTTIEVKDGIMKINLDGVKIKIRIIDDNYVLKMGDTENQTPYNPLFTLIQDEDSDGRPESIISPIIGLAKTMYNLFSIMLAKYHNDAFKPLMIPADDKIINYYHRQFGDEEVDGQRVLNIQPEAVMLTSPEGNKPEVLGIGTDFVDSLGMRLEKLRELMMSVVQQRLVNRYQESGLAKSLDLEQQNIPLFYMASLLEDFETNLYSTLFNTGIKIIYNKAFTNYDKDKNRENLIELHTITSNFELKNTIEKVLAKEDLKFHGITEKEINDIFKDIPVNNEDKDNINNINNEDDKDNEDSNDSDSSLSNVA